MDQVITENERVLYERMQEEMIPLVRQHLIAITAYYGGELKQHATGTLVRFADRHFLVTAAHAIERYHEALDHYSDLRLLLDNGEADNLVPLYGNYYVTQKVIDRENPRLVLSGERNDIWDVGLWELDHQTVAALTNKRFLNRSSISITADLSDGAFFLAGCPCSWVTADVHARTVGFKWFKYISHPYPECDEIHNYDGRFHLALGFADDPELPTELQGISGCPIWKLSDVPVSDNWDVTHAKLVAIETHVVTGKHRAICGTRWHCVLPVLENMHPGIREGFRIWLPGRE